MDVACLARRKYPATDVGGAARALAGTRPARAIVTNILPSATDAKVPDPLEHACIRPRAGFAIGVPWVSVLLHAAALVGSSMAGLAMALFLH